MPKYTVEMTITKRVTVVVQAKSKEQAEEKANILDIIEMQDMETIDWEVTGKVKEDE